MSPEDYWHGDPELTAAYREAYRLRKEERNWEMWLQGLYIFHAVSIALSNAFGKGKKQEYMDKPLDIFPPTEEELEERREEEAQQLEKTLNAFAERVRKRDGRIQSNSSN